MPEPRPASTVVLARPALGGIEVFLVRRHDNVAFMGGAHVFPGGRVDAADHLDDPSAWCDGVDRAAARLNDRPAAEAVAFHVAAVRELFEEAGVLLARDAGGTLVAIHQDNQARFDEYRAALAGGALTLRGLIAREGLRLALDQLAVFANWVTPAIELKRFDTMFFLAIAPGAIALPPPTWTTLRWLSRWATVADAWRWANAAPVPRVQPGFLQRDDGTRIVLLPGDPGCPRVEGFEAEETRFLLANGRWTPI